MHLNAGCVQWSIVRGVRASNFYSSALPSKPGYKIHTEPRLKLFKKLKKYFLSHIRFNLEDDDNKAVDFNEETISFTCQLIKI